MPYRLSITISPLFIGFLGRGAPFSKVQCWRRPRTSIHMLDDDSLLNIFYFCRSTVLEKDKYGDIQLENPVSEHWWYKLAQVCRRWRYLVLEDSHHLGLSLLCKHGTPVADMLAHSPSLPLIIDHDDHDHELTPEDEEWIMLALQHRDRVQRINLQLPASSLQRLITAIDGRFPTLESLYLGPPAKHDTLLTLPATFEAPQLRHLVLDHFTSPIGSRLLPNAVGLVALVLRWIHPSTYLHPNRLLRTLSLLPQLEILEIGFLSPVPNHEIERQLTHTPIAMQITLPNLGQFAYWGTSAYLESLLPEITAPRLEKLAVHFFNQLSFSIPHLLSFIRATEIREFGRARFLFHPEAVAVYLQPRVGDKLTNFYVGVVSQHLNWQVSSVAQIFNALSPLSSSVSKLVLDYGGNTGSSEYHNQVDPAQWRELLRSFGNLKILCVHNGLVGDVSRALRLDGEPAMELLPGLRKLVCPRESVDDKTFIPFIHDRKAADQPIDLIGRTSPVGYAVYRHFSSTGVSYIITGQTLCHREPPKWMGVWLRSCRYAAHVVRTSFYRTLHPSPSPIPHPHYIQNTFCLCGGCPC